MVTAKANGFRVVAMVLGSGLVVVLGSMFAYAINKADEVEVKVHDHEAAFGHYGMEARMGGLESDIGEINADLDEIKADVKTLLLRE